MKKGPPLGRPLRGPSVRDTALGRGPASVGRDESAVDHLRVVGCEEQREMGDVLRLQHRRNDAAVETGPLTPECVDPRRIDAVHDVGLNATRACLLYTS